MVETPENMGDAVAVIHALYAGMLSSLVIVAAAQAQTPATETTAATTAATAVSTEPGTLTIQADKGGPTINRDIFGHFSEHIGEGVYGGIWVGKDSKIPNLRGIRSDVVAALRAIKVPVLRWPGGCFADRYHWRNGIGPQARRPVTFNAIWGGVTEPNTFGTHEYMDLLEQIGAEAYLSVNMGTGSLQEAIDWLDYMTNDKPTDLAKERAANGHPAPYRVKYMGMGNEMWGCGGVLSANHYVEQMKGYAMAVESFHPDQRKPSMFQRSPNAMKRIAVGDASTWTQYTEAVMSAWKVREPWFYDIEGLSLHHYTYGGSIGGAPATGFSEKQYATYLSETRGIEGAIVKRTDIMDKYDPQKKIALVVDEWGGMTKPEGDGLSGRSGNSIRDALVAALHFNAFARHADRVRMTNISMTVNIGQPMILTDKEKMLLTPTYYAYKLYVPFQDAQFIPIDFQPGLYAIEKVTLPKVDAIAARGKDGRIWVALTNLDPNKATAVTINLQGVAATRATGETLSADKMDSSNSFAAPNTVVPKPVSFAAADGKLALELAPHSVTVVQLEP